MENKKCTAVTAGKGSDMGYYKGTLGLIGNTPLVEVTNIEKELGLEATGKNLNDLKLQKNNEKKVAEENLEAAKELAAKIAEAKIVTHIKVGEGGRTFGSVSSKEIAEEVKAQLNLNVDKKKIQLKEAIKTLGTHNVSVKLHPQVTAELKVVVQEEA